MRGCHPAAARPHNLENPMSVSSNAKTLLATWSAVAALSACGGADEVASPGEGAFPPPPPVAAPPPAGPPTGGPAADCPERFANVGTIVDRDGAMLRVCQLPSLITGGLLVPRREGTIYTISGRTDVGQDQGGDVTQPLPGAQDGVLTIEAGVRLYGSAGLDYIVVNRGSQINVQGTATEPVIMTSRQSIEGTTGEDSIGQWGGLVILGRAPISNCDAPGIPAGDATCQAIVEGANALYGGNGPSDSSGSLRYLRVQHTGFQVLPGNELNGITLAGVGSGTTIEYVQVHNSSDDGIEWFGGTVNARYLVMTGIDDDSFDTDTGYNGAIQFAIVVQRPNGGNHMTEMSGSSRLPLSSPKIANATFVGRTGAGAGPGIILNSGSNAQYYNTIVTKPATGSGTAASCLDIDDYDFTNPRPTDSTGTLGAFHSVFFSCSIAFGDDADGAAALVFNAGTNNTATGTSTLTDTFVNGPDEAAVPAYNNLTAVSPFFQQVDYIGAVRDANDTWWQGWTCGLTADTPC
jgi:hypothetical protein